MMCLLFPSRFSFIHPPQVLRTRFFSFANNFTIFVPLEASLAIHLPPLFLQVFFYFYPRTCTCQCAAAVILPLYFTCILFLSCFVLRVLERVAFSCFPPSSYLNIYSYMCIEAIDCIDFQLALTTDSSFILSSS